MTRDEVLVEKIRPGLFCVRNHWETANWTTHNYEAFNFANANMSSVSTFNFASPAKLVKTTVEEQRSEYSSWFDIEGQSCPFNFAVSLVKTNDKVTASLKLAQSFMKSEEKQSEASIDKRPTFVWAYNGMDHKGVHHLKHSWIVNHWTSSMFEPKFALPDSGSQGLTFLLWIEFDYTSCGAEKNTLRQMGKMFVEQTHCDVRFIFKNGESVGSHVNILSSRSPVFAAMFTHDMKETITRQVKIEDIQPDIFKQLLYYMYAGQLEKRMGRKSAKLLYVAADKYDIEDLKNECVCHLTTSIHLYNVLDLMTWAHLHSIEDMKETALVFMSIHGKEICKQRDWESLTKNYPDLCVIATRRIMENMTLLGGRVQILSSLNDRDCQESPQSILFDQGSVP